MILKIIVSDNFTFYAFILQRSILVSNHWDIDKSISYYLHLFHVESGLKCLNFKVYLWEVDVKKTNAFLYFKTLYYQTSCFLYMLV